MRARSSSLTQRAYLTVLCALLSSDSIVANLIECTSSTRFKTSVISLMSFGADGKNSLSSANRFARLFTISLCSSSYEGASALLLQMDIRSDSLRSRNFKAGKNYLSVDFRIPVKILRRMLYRLLSLSTGLESLSMSHGLISSMCLSSVRPILLLLITKFDSS